MSHTCSTGNRSGVHAGLTSCFTPQRACFISAPICGHALYSWEAHHLPVEEMAAAWGYQHPQYGGRWFLYSAETPNVTASCNWCLPTPWSLGCCWDSRCSMCLGFFPGCRLLLAQRVNLDVHLCYITVQNLVWVLECSTKYYWKQRHTTDMLCPMCAAVILYVFSAYLRPTVQLAEVVQH